MERKRSSASRKTTVGGVAELVAVSGQREAANSTPPAQVGLLLRAGSRRVPTDRRTCYLPWQVARTPALVVEEGQPMGDLMQRVRWMVVALAVFGFAAIVTGLLRSL